MPPVQAYVRNRSAISNARQHLNKNCYVKVDIKDCFPSITKLQVFEIFLKLGFTDKISSRLAQICTYMDSLPQGAPTSPIISNLRMERLDLNILEIANKFEAVYTRYADDIVLSGQNLDIETLDSIKTLVIEEGFAVNLQKSFLAVNPSKMVVTGVSVAGADAKLPKTQKRETKKLAHDLVYRIAAIDALRKDPFVYDRVMGRLTYWSLVEPHAEFPKRYKLMLTDRFAPLMG